MPIASQNELPAWDGGRLGSTIAITVESELLPIEVAASDGAEAVAFSVGRGSLDDFLLAHKTMLWATCHGLPIERIRDRLEDRLPDKPFTRADAERLHTLLVTKVLSYLEAYTEDPTLENLASHFNTEAWKLQGDLDWQSPERTSVPLRKVLSGVRVSENQWKKLKKRLGENFGSKIAESRTPAGESTLYWKHAKTVSGRLGPPAQGLQVRSLDVSYTRDEVVKRCAYALVDSQFELLAITDTELVLEVEQTKVDVDAVTKIVEASAKLAIGALARGCCRCEIVNQWCPPCVCQSRPKCPGWTCARVVWAQSEAEETG